MYEPEMFQFDGLQCFEKKKPVEMSCFLATLQTSLTISVSVSYLFDLLTKLVPPHILRYDHKTKNAKFECEDTSKIILHIADKISSRFIYLDNNPCIFWY